LEASLYVSRLIIIGADSNARDGLAGGVGGALVVASRVADQSAVGGGRRALGLQHALGVGGGAIGQVSGAGLGHGAVRRAEVTRQTLNLDAQLVRLAAIGLGVLVVSGVGRSLDAASNGVRGHHVDAADTSGANVLGHQDVAGHTPRGTPGVLDDPVVLARSGAKANSQDTMVQLGAASSLEDTIAVQLEARLVSLNGNGDGLLGDGSDELALLVLGNIRVRGDGGSVAGSLGSLAGQRALGDIGVVGLGGDTAILDDVLKGVVHQTTLAALVTLGNRAINQLLLAERDEVLGGNGVGTLDGASGGEGPARAALALILDRGDGTLSAPVDGASIDLGQHNLMASASGVEAAQVHGGPLLASHISELVDTNTVGLDTLLKSSIVLVDEGNIVLEDLEAGGLLSTRVSLAIGLLEIGKHGLNLSI